MGLESVMILNGAPQGDVVTLANIAFQNGVAQLVPPEPPPVFDNPWSSPDMTSATAPSPYVVSAKSETSGSEAWKAMDQSGTATTWASAWGTPAGQWWTLYVGEDGVQINKFKLSGYGNTYSIKDFKIQGSNNNSNWTDIYSGTASDLYGTVQTFNFDQSATYKYLRMYCVTSYHSAQILIFEFVFEGFQPD